MSGLQAAASMEESPHDRSGGRIRRVGHDVEGSSGETEVGRVDSCDGRSGSKALLEFPGSAAVQLDGHHTMPGLDQRPRDGAGSCPDVQDERSFRERSLPDQPAGSVLVELMPAPPWRRPSHGDAPS